MRTVPERMMERLAQGATSLCHVWLITRADGARFAFTDHDQDVAFDDLIAEAQTGFTPGAIEKGFGLAPDSAAIEGALNSDAITAQDLAAGLWDRARVDVYRLDWTDPSLRVHLFAGLLGESERAEDAFKAELRGLKSLLDQPIGRVYSRFCDAVVGDARCGVDLTAPAFSGAGTVQTVLGAQAFLASGLAAFAGGLFSRGKLSWDSGGGGEVARHRIELGGVVIELLTPPAVPLTVGQAFTITAGCDQRLSTCRDRFANVLNFRGFPHIPGPDALIAGPSAQGGNDGGSRQS